MSGLWRITILTLFAAAGIGLALGVALSSDSSTEAALDSSLVAASSSSPTFDPFGSAAEKKPVIVPLVEQVHAPIAGRPGKDDWLLAQTSNPSSTTPVTTTDLLNLLGQTKAASAPTSTQTPAGTTPTTSEPSQGAVMDILRSQLQEALSKQTGGGPPTDNSAGKATNTLPASVPSPIPPQGNAAASTPNKSIPRITKIAGEGDNNLSIHIQDSDLRDVLELLSEQGGLNILPSPSVQGKVSASLTGIDIDTALAAILRSTGYVARHDGTFIYVGTPADFKAMAQAYDSLGTRVYHINYVRSTDVQALVTPLLTPGIGTISITAPSEEGIGSDGNKAGGNQFAGGEAILVHDFCAVLDQVDQVISEVDRKPAQVSIEAMILKVALDDKYSLGVDFAFLRDNPHVHLFTGSPLSSLDALKPNGGLSFGYLDGSTAAFVNALENIGDTNIIASPRLMVVDKARAEILIGNQDGYVNSTVTETSTTQNVQFLETGAQLRLRPFISSDGMVRMEVHPELSTGNVEVTGGVNPLTLPHKDVTQVTTNIMVPDGCTVVIGGLMREELDNTTTQIPFLGSMPGVGFLFRNKKEETHKKEIIVLITPHIVCEPQACCEGDKVAAEFHRRQAVFADQMSPLGKRYLGRKYYRLAQGAWANGDQATALRFIDLSIHFDPQSRAAIDLRADIWNGHLTGDHTLVPLGMEPGGGAMAMPGEPYGTPPSEGIEMRDGEGPDSLPAPGNLEAVPQGRPVPMDSAMKFSAAGSPSATRKVILASPPTFSAESPILAARNAARSQGTIPAMPHVSAPAQNSGTSGQPSMSDFPMSMPAMPDMPPMGAAQPTPAMAQPFMSVQTRSAATLSDPQYRQASLNVAPGVGPPAASTFTTQSVLSSPSAVKTLDGNRLPSWIVENLMRPASANTSATGSDKNDEAQP